MHLETISLLSLAYVVMAHMSLWYPGPLGGTKESNRVSTITDPELNFPLGCCDSEGQPTLSSPGLCRGHLDLFDREEPQVIWTPGQAAFFQLSNHTYTPGALGSTHYGGSCQVGFSIDHGKSWKAAASYNGNCPHRAGGGSPEAQTFHFNVPTSMPVGKALFGWIWLNREHESFMNCAVVQISHGLLVVESASAKPEVSTSTSPTMTLRPSTISNQYISTNLAIESGLQKDSHDDSQSDHQTVHKLGEGTCPSHFQSSTVSVARVSKDQRDVKQAKRVAIELDVRDRTACDWDTAPSMAVSYYTVDAACRPNAKLIYDGSDKFEIGWAVPCGNVEGDGMYPIKMLDCHR